MIPWKGLSCELRIPGSLLGGSGLGPGNTIGKEDQSKFRVFRKEKMGDHKIENCRYIRAYQCLTNSRRDALMKIPVLKKASRKQCFKTFKHRKGREAK